MAIFDGQDPISKGWGAVEDWLKSEETKGKRRVIGILGFIVLLLLIRAGLRAPSKPTDKTSSPQITQTYFLTEGDKKILGILNKAIEDPKVSDMIEKITAERTGDGIVYKYYMTIASEEKTALVALNSLYFVARKDKRNETIKVELIKNGELQVKAEIDMRQYPVFLSQDLIAASYFWKEFDQNKIRADKKYTNKIIGLWGTVERIDRESGHPYILLQGDGYFSYIHCFINPIFERDLVKLQKGQWIDIAGTYKLERSGDIVIVDCYFWER